MVLLIIIPIKWLFHWEYTLFSDKPKSWKSLPSGYVNSLLLKMTIEIVDLPIENGGSFHSYVKLWHLESDSFQWIGILCEEMARSPTTPPMAPTSMSSPVAASRNFIGTTTLAGKIQESYGGASTSQIPIGIRYSLNKSCAFVWFFYVFAKTKPRLKLCTLFSTETKLNPKNCTANWLDFWTPSCWLVVCQCDHYHKRNAPKQQHLRCLAQARILFIQ